MRRPPSNASPVWKGLVLPYGCLLHMDSIEDTYVVVWRGLDLVEKPVPLVHGWRTPGPTLSFCARHEIKAIQLGLRKGKA